MFWFFKSSAKDRARQLILPEVPISTFMPVNDDKLAVEDDAGYHARYYGGAAEDEQPTGAGG